MEESRNIAFATGSGRHPAGWIRERLFFNWRILNEFRLELRTRTGRGFSGDPLFLTMALKS
jgi:hypothetical protein